MHFRRLEHQLLPVVRALDMWWGASDERADVLARVLAAISWEFGHAYRVPYFPVIPTFFVRFVILSVLCGLTETEMECKVECRGRSEGVILVRQAFAARAI